MSQGLLIGYRPRSNCHILVMSPDPSRTGPAAYLQPDNPAATWCSIPLAFSVINEMSIEPTPGIGPLAANWRFVRFLPVHAPRSEWRLGRNLPPPKSGGDKYSVVWSQCRQTCQNINGIGQLVIFNTQVCDCLQWNMLATGCNDGQHFQLVK